MGYKPSHDKFVEKLKRVAGNEYKTIGQYTGVRKKVLILHEKCGFEWNAVPEYIWAGHRCPLCAGSYVDDEIYKKRVLDRFGEEFKVLGTYEKTSKKLKFKHMSCGYEFDMTPNGFDANNGCPKCNKRQRYSTEDYRQQLEEITNGEIICLGAYTNAYKRILHKHLTCGYEWETSPTSIRGGSRCPHCYGNIKGNHDEFVHAVKELTGDEYKVIGEYENRHKHLLMRHETCGTEWMITPGKFKAGRRCPNCMSSNGEKRIEEYLNANGYSFQREKTFPDLRDVYPLRFDFAIFFGGAVVALVEFDGQHHFRAIEFFGGESHYRGTVARDEMKNNYCKDKGIPLIRIPYTEKNIEGYLSGVLSQIIGDQLNMII